MSQFGVQGQGGGDMIGSTIAMLLILGMLITLVYMAVT